MKRLVLCAVAALLCAVACDRAKDDPARITNDEIEISVKGLMGDLVPADGTKAELQQVVRVVWNGGETVYAYCGKTYLGELTATPDPNDNRIATMSGKITAPAKGATVTLVYSPLLADKPSLDDDAMSFDISAQDDDNVPFVIYGTFTFTDSADIQDLYVPFKFATSVMKVNCAGIDQSKPIRYATISGVNTVCKLTLSDSGEPVVSSETAGTIKRTKGIQWQDTRAIFTIATVESPAFVGRKLKLSVGGIPYASGFTGDALGTAQSYNTVFELKCDAPEGTIPALFSVSPDKQVYFSRANLYYDIAGDKWEFFENQADARYDGGIPDDRIWLFCYSYGEHSKNPIDSTVVGHNVFVDWGVAYCQSHNIQKTDTWRTPTFDEWDYIFEKRELNGGTGEGYSYSYVEYFDSEPIIQGLVIFPDDYTKVHTDYLKYIPEGCAFLNFTGSRQGEHIGYYDMSYYWSSTDDLRGDFDDTAMGFWFEENAGYELMIGGATSYFSQAEGSGVRLVMDFEE